MLCERGIEAKCSEKCFMIIVAIEHIWCIDAHIFMHK